MDAESVASFVGITGASEEQAVQMLSITDGNLEQAINIFFAGGLEDMGGGDGGGGGGGASATSDLPEPFALTWGIGVSVIPESWTLQTLTFNGCEIAQPKNGPCGVLAAIQATVASLSMGSACVADEDFGGKTGAYAPKSNVSDVQLVGAFEHMLRRIANRAGGMVTLVSFTDRTKDLVQITTQQTPLDNLNAELNKRIGEYKEAGGLILLVYAAILTLGQSTVKQDIAGGTGEAPLIVGPNKLCTSELMNLLMRGVANGNVSAYGATGMPNSVFASEDSVGMLSYSEVDAGVPLADSFKFPTTNVWVLHGGDHFTTLCAQKSTPPADDNKAPFVLVHMNGLPPAGPRVTRILITPINGDVGKAPEKHQDTYFKPVPGEIEDVVQADKASKVLAPEDWTKWKYEVVLAVDRPDVQGAVRTADMAAPHTFEQGAPPAPGTPWRCTHCYADRFKTMCFGQNGGEDVVCSNCSKAPSDAGFSLWLTFDQLPSGWQAKMTRRHSPKMIALLQTRWPGCKVEPFVKTEKLPAV